MTKEIFLLNYIQSGSWEFVKHPEDANHMFLRRGSFQWPIRISSYTTGDLEACEQHWCFHLGQKYPGINLIEAKKKDFKEAIT